MRWHIIRIGKKGVDRGYGGCDSWDLCDRCESWIRVVIMFFQLGFFSSSIFICFITSKGSWTLWTGTSLGGGRWLGGSYFDYSPIGWRVNIYRRWRNASKKRFGIWFYGRPLDRAIGYKMHSVNNHFDAQSGRPFVFPRLGASISGLCKTSLVTPKPHLSNRQPAREKVKAKEGNEEDCFGTFFDPNPGL